MAHVGIGFPCKKMTLQRIDLFAPLTNQYGVVSTFTRELADAIDRKGVITEILTADKNNPGQFINKIFEDAPDCTLSFNGLLPDEEGRFLCDLIRIPHVAYLTDAPKHFFSLVHSKRNIIVCIDQDFQKTFQQFRFPHVLFLPHAVSKNLKPAPVFEPVYDVLMLNSYIDYEAVHAQWEKRFGPVLKAILEEAAEWTLTDRDISYFQAFVQTMDKHLRAGKMVDPTKLDYSDVLDQLETYVGGKSRVELLQAIEKADVHVFGTNADGWKKHLKGKSNIHIHGEVPFKEAIELIKKSKIVLNATPEIKRGLHERLLSGLACGATVLALETPFLAENFTDEKDILFYRPRHWDEVNKKIDTYLKDENKRRQLAQKGRENVMSHHTWDHRAEALLTSLPPILEQIKANT